MDMDWTQAVTIIGTNLAFIFGFVIFLLGRMDSNKRDTDHKIESAQKENNTRFNGLENRLTSMESEIKNVNQNLGQRIESTNQRIDNTNQRITDLKTDMNQRLSTIEGYLVPKKVFHFEEHDHKDEPKEN